MANRRRTPHLLTLSRAAESLGLPSESVRQLASAGYLHSVADPAGGEAFFHQGDVKAFVARNADNGSGNLVLPVAGPETADALLVALSDRCERMARRALQIYTAAFPEASRWGEPERARFVEQATSRFEAILAVASHGAEVADALTDELQEVGAAAAWTGASLPQLLANLRISRDLVVQTAIQLAEERGQDWSLPLAVLVTRVLPSMDRLTDSVTHGYWAAVMVRGGHDEQISPPAGPGSHTQEGT